MRNVDVLNFTQLSALQSQLGKTLSHAFARTPPRLFVFNSSGCLASRRRRQIEIAS